MKVNWIIDEYEKSIEELVREVRRQGHVCDFVDYYSLLAGSNYMDDPNGLPYSKGQFAPEECVVFQGSIQTAKWLLKNKAWTPTAWLTEENYRCTHYYPQLSKFLFNETYVLLPRADVTRNLDWLNSILGMHGCLFIRPDSGFKSFSGQVFELDRFEKDWHWAEEFCPPHECVLISNPKDIQEEYRFICCKGEIITGSKYKSRHALDISTAITKPAKAKCQEVLDTGFCPDPMFVLDICKGMDDNYYLLEVNAFSTAGLYDCDLSKIVERASAIAWQEHQEIYSQLSS